MTYTAKEVSLHTHSYYCGHGIGEVDSYVKQAESTPLKLLGFSEHCPTPADDISDRMKYKDLESYVNDVKTAAKNTKITVLNGMECDWREDLLNYYSQLNQEFDYLIGSVHYVFVKEENRLRYVGRIADMAPLLDQYVDKYTQMLSSGLFITGCHPDLFLSLLEWNDKAYEASEKIIDTAIKYNIPLEINGQGLRRTVTDASGKTRMAYPVKEFWQLALQKGALVCANSDAHDPKFVYESRIFDFADKSGIKLIDWEIDSGRLLWKK